MPTIKIHYFSDDLPRLQKTGKGDWIDLYAAQTMQLRAGDFALIPLGVSMQLPEGYEARTAPRSSTFRRWGILQANSVGVIDNSYCGTNDEWKLPVYATRDTTLEKGEPVLPGDILISGETSDGLQKHAQGEVYAYTWHKASGKFRRTKTSEQLTGENKNFYILRLFSREIFSGGTE